MTPILSSLAIGLMATNFVIAHPGHNLANEAAELKEFHVPGRRSVSSCTAALERRGHASTSAQRRSELAQTARAKRSLVTERPLRRDFTEYNVSHASSAVYGEDETLLFTDNSSCLLTPESTFGPYVFFQRSRNMEFVF